ncbi:MAG: hypothetical protein EKK33_18705 [Bradyrhizobiaceae bacterium]|nr:MAG: hypothetical protein EKK33_18705 [Bradyrhizobiaceae bacterium]
MSKEPKEVRDIVREFKRALLAVRELHGRAMEIGIKDIEAAAEVAHDALLACARDRNITFS